MAKQHHTSKQIVSRLRAAEAERGRQKHGRMPLDQARRLKHLEQENRRLTKLVADLYLDNAF